MEKKISLAPVPNTGVTGTVLKSDLFEKPLDQSAIPLIAPLGDIECFNCSDWITITLGT